MAAFAGYQDIPDYINRRCREQSITLADLTQALGFRRTYLYTVVNTRRFLPSRKRLEKIAQYFGDDPYILFVLADLESPPPDMNDRDLRELHAIAKSLTRPLRQQLLAFAKNLFTLRK